MKRVKHFILAITIFLNPILASFAQGSSYYEVPETGRPPNAFSLCCCSKEGEDIKQAIYSCRYFEVENCPAETKQYKVSKFECPGSLIVKQ